MDQTEITQRVSELERRRNTLEDEVNELDEQIAALRKQCAHERDVLMNGDPAWWCIHCGGEVKKSV